MGPPFHVCSSCVLIVLRDLDEPAKAYAPWGYRSRDRGHSITERQLRSARCNCCIFGPPNPAVPLTFMEKRTPDKELAIGDRVMCLEIPVKGYTGTIIKRGRVLHLKVWLVELDEPAKRGAGIVRLRKVRKLRPEEDAGQLRS
jgi:hypothetical protein